MRLKAAIRVLVRQGIPLLLAASLGLPVYMILLDRKPPYSEFSVLVNTPDVVPGGTLRFTLFGRVNRHCWGIVHREIIDSQGKIHAIIPVAPLLAPLKGSEYALERELQIPSSMSWGPAIYHGYPSYQCNPLQWIWPIKIPTTTLRFNVAPPRLSSIAPAWLSASGVLRVGAGASGSAAGRSASAALP